MKKTTTAKTEPKASGNAAKRKSSIKALAKTAGVGLNLSAYDNTPAPAHKSDRRMAKDAADAKAMAASLKQPLVATPPAVPHKTPQITVPRSAQSFTVRRADGKVATLPMHSLTPILVNETRPYTLQFHRGLPSDTAKTNIEGLYHVAIDGSVTQDAAVEQAAPVAKSATPKTPKAPKVAADPADPLGKFAASPFHATAKLKPGKDAYLPTKRMQWVIDLWNLLLAGKHTQAQIEKVNAGFTPEVVKEHLGYMDDVSLTGTVLPEAAAKK